jgi:hypothetical protein
LIEEGKKAAIEAAAIKRARAEAAEDETPAPGGEVSEPAQE